MQKVGFSSTGELAFPDHVRGLNPGQGRLRRGKGFEALHLPSDPLDEPMILLEGAELTEHLGYEPCDEPAPNQSNRRNGTTRKTVKGNDGALPIDVPRDRSGSFEPALIKKGQTRIDGMDDEIIGLYAAGLSTRDIRAHLEEVYGLRVSADLISRVHDVIGEPTFADAILDRLIHNAYRIELDGQSMRKTDLEIGDERNEN